MGISKSQSGKVLSYRSCSINLAPKEPYRQIERSYIIPIDQIPTFQSIPALITSNIERRKLQIKVIGNVLLLKILRQQNINLLHTHLSYS